MSHTTRLRQPIKCLSRFQLRAASSTASTGSRYPPYPSVQHLLHINGISEEDAKSIKPTGPNGRLLKGDVLAHLGKIDNSYSSSQSSRIEKLGHLNLSYVKKAIAETEKPADRPPVLEKELELDTEVAVPISLSAVLATQNRIRDSLGLNLPLSTFIARASEIANENLPKAKVSALSADQLFDSVLGLDKVSKTSRGRYVPHITSFAPAPTASRKSSTSVRKNDIIDILAASFSPKSRTSPTPSFTVTAPLGSSNVFSVMASKGEEKRVRIYLERVKTVLESEPGRCVL